MAIAQAQSIATFRATGVQQVEKASPENGTRADFNNVEFIFYHGYWVRYYPPLDESLASRKKLIDNLTRRTFHHTEPGINTPGERLSMARDAYLAEQDPALKRVNAAMLAGALFNRATDIFTAIVELEEKGVKISRDNELMKSCGRYFEEALELGKNVKHHSGEEGIDELWGEPFRAFTIPIATYYESRFIKVAQTMSNIDQLAGIMKTHFCQRREFSGLEIIIDVYAEAAKRECETMKSDTNIFVIWPKFVAASEQLGNVTPTLQADCSTECQYVIENSKRALIAGRDLINWIARARVPMPGSTERYQAKCGVLADRLRNC